MQHKNVPAEKSVRVSSGSYSFVDKDGVNPDRARNTGSGVRSSRKTEVGIAAVRGITPTPPEASAAPVSTGDADAATLAAGDTQVFPAAPPAKQPYVRRPTQFGMAPVSADLLAAQEVERERLREQREIAVMTYASNFSFTFKERGKDLERLVYEASSAIGVRIPRTNVLSGAKVIASLKSLGTVVPKLYQQGVLSGIRDQVFVDMVKEQSASLAQLLRRVTAIDPSKASALVSESADKIVESASWTASLGEEALVNNESFLAELRAVVTLHLMAIESGNLEAVRKIALFQALYVQGWVPVGIASDGSFTVIVK